MNLDNDDTYTIGTSNGLLVACRNGNTLHFLYDEDEGDYLYDGLEADSAICWSTGTDVITIARSSFQCPSTWYSAVGSGDYNGYVLHMHGQGDNDSLFGGDGRDKICGGSGNDRVFGHDGNDILDGLSGHDTMRGGDGDFDELWGHNGDDCLRDEDGSDDYLNGESNTDRCVWDEGAAFETLTCGGAGYTPNTVGQGATSCTEYGEDGELECDFRCSWD